MKIANAYLMKEININHVRQVMKRVETATKPQLASLTKLSVVTVNSLVKELCELGELFEDETVPSNGGRPALTYRYNYDFSLALVMYINEKQGQDLITATVINLEDNMVFREEYTMPAFDQRHFYEIIGNVLAQHASIKVIGIGIPGQTVNGEITVSSHRQLEGVRMIEDLEAQFGLPVMVENDVNAAISGYCAKRELDEDQCVIGIYFPTKYPPGMGIYVDGKVIKGKRGMAGEVKYLPMGIDWYDTVEKEAFIATVCKMIQMVNAILAPDQVVIYQKMVEEDAVVQAWQMYQGYLSMPSYPDIILIDSFQEDFEAGMRWLTLKALEPDLVQFN
ncbi:ROK family protein [Paenibacillus sp. AD87]|uniref:ROK family protein n=1 Tax=Paenibacillus sp. AD87 TaxID=1528787 RepID=UPI0007E41A64|nr:ROK family protein [Paenibacillus sp. AD87]OAX49028.1 N-acetylglucosamine repressor [Paenibacillus sp. AD87]